MSKNHKGAKMTPFHGSFRSFLCRNEEDDEQVIYLKHCDDGFEGTTIKIDSVNCFMRSINSYGGFNKEKNKNKKLKHNGTTVAREPPSQFN